MLGCTATQMHAKMVPMQLVTTPAMDRQLSISLQVFEGTADEAREMAASRQLGGALDTGGAMQPWTSARIKRRA